MSYGFDPNELIETKIDLIDKDGFHGKGMPVTPDDGDNNNNSEPSSDDTANALHEGIYMNYYTSIERSVDYSGPEPEFSETRTQSIYTSVVVDATKYTSMFSPSATTNRNDYTALYIFYTGEKLDDSGWKVVDETSIAYGDQNESVGFYLSGTAEGPGIRVGNDWFIFAEWTDLESIKDPATGNPINVVPIPYGTPVHCVIAFNADGMRDTQFMFVDDIWNLEGLS